MMKLPRNMILSPSSKTRLASSQTVGYFGGSFPSILIRLNGDPFELKMGQCIPCEGQNVYVENHFDRTGSAQIIQNAPVNILPDASNATAGLPLYRGTYGFTVAAAGANTSQGFGLMTTRGRARVLVHTETTLQFRLYVNASPSFLDYKPAGMDDTLNLYHSSGDTLSSVMGIAGYYGADFISDWVGESGFNWADRLTVQSARTGTSEFFIEAGMALMGTTTAQDARINLEVDYLGQAGVAGV